MYQVLIFSYEADNHNMHTFGYVHDLKTSDKKKALANILNLFKSSFVSEQTREDKKEYAKFLFKHEYLSKWTWRRRGSFDLFYLIDNTPTNQNMQQNKKLKVIRNGNVFIIDHKNDDKLMVKLVLPMFDTKYCFE
jgi:hypothetical protein